MVVVSLAWCCESQLAIHKLAAFRKICLLTKLLVKKLWTWGEILG